MLKNPLLLRIISDCAEEINYDIDFNKFNLYLSYSNHWLIRQLLKINNNLTNIELIIKKLEKIAFEAH